MITLAKVNEGTRVSSSSDALASQTIKNSKDSQELARPDRGLSAEESRNVVARGQTALAPEFRSSLVAVSSVEGRKAVKEAHAHISGQGLDPQNFAPTQIVKDELGIMHVRFQRLHQGVQVFGEQVLVHVRPESGNSMTGDVAAIPQTLGAEPKMKKRDAVRLALEAFGRDGTPSVQRYVFKVPHEDRYIDGFIVNIWRFEEGDEGPQHVSYFVDGAANKIVDQFHDVGSSHIWKQRKIETGGQSSTPRIVPEGTKATVDVEGADDSTLYSGKVDVTATQRADGTWELSDSSRGKGVITRDANNRSRGSSAKVFTDDNNVWGEDTDSDRQSAAVDAHYGAMMTYDTLKDVIGINSIDLKGHKLISNVHIRRNYVNAFWDGSTMNYGDGDGRTAGPLTTLDIAGHEIAHGLTQNTAGLIYRNESGGLNESYSDVAGFLVEWYAAQKNPNLTFDWTMGEDAWTPGNGDPTDGLRYMNNPTKDNYSVDNYANYPRQREVHGSSGIANHAFYQLAEPNNDGKVANSVSGIAVQDGIGIESAAKIWFRALIHYMTPNTTFAQARQATIQAAIDLHGEGSTEVAKVREAWTSVGVENNNTIPESELGPVSPVEIPAPADRAAA